MRIQPIKTSVPHCITNRLRCFGTTSNKACIMLPRCSPEQQIFPLARRSRIGKFYFPVSVR